MKKLILYFIIILVLFISCTGVSTNDDNNRDDNDVSIDLPDIDIPFNKDPDWISMDIKAVSTGLAVADINGDELADLIVANGNDILRQSLVVYYNNGNGNISTRPNWRSDDIDYHGHIAVGDIDKNGFNDIVVSVFLGESGFGSKGKTKIYYNYNGELEKEPSWESIENHYSFNIDLGDIDNDGDLDIAVATGESYTYKKEPNRIYINENGDVNPVAYWESDVDDYSLDASFGDMDNDGDLDIIFAGSNAVSTIYTNNNGQISKKPTWINEETSNSNSVIIGDINKDGYRDIALSDNYQQGGTGRFKVYYNDNGILSNEPDWQSEDRGYGSGIFLQDLNNDGFMELISGTWGESRIIGNGKLRVYQNVNGLYTPKPMWLSNSKSVIEAITCYDLDKNSEEIINQEITIEKNKSIFYLNHQPVQQIKSISVNDNVIDINDYCYNRELSWVSINKDVLIEEKNLVKLTYLYSSQPDMIVSNWDSDKGNYIFNNLNILETY